MTTGNRHTTDQSPARRALTGTARSLAGASAALLIATSLASPAAAAPTLVPATTPSPSPDPSFGPAGNAAPAFIQCPGVIAHAGTPESVSLQVTDPDGDPVTLTASASPAGAETGIRDHVLTYTAPSDFSGQDFVQVTADDAHGGTTVCDLSIWVEARATPAPTAPQSPSPTPTDRPTTPAPTPTDRPTTPAPSPTGSAPTPTAAPTGQAPTSAPAPTAEPTSGSPTSGPGEPSAPRSSSGGPGSGGTGTTDGAGPSGSSGTAPATTPGADGGTPGASDGTGSASGSAGGSPTAGSAPSATASPGLLNRLAHRTTLSCSIQAVTDARTLIDALTAGLVTPSGVTATGTSPVIIGTTPTGASAGDRQDADTADAMDRTSAVTGSSMILFSGVAVLLLLFIVLSLLALPRKGRRH